MPNPWILIDLAVACCVAMLTGIIIPQILLIAFRKQLFDDNDPRKIHKGAVPRLGGIAFFPSIIFSIFLLFGWVILFRHDHIVVEILNSMLPLCFIVCASTIIYLVGVCDDLVGVRYSAKFVAQIICALLIYAGGIHLDDLHGLLGIHTLPVWLSVVLTVLVTVFVTNAVNLIDGIDGLASGLSGVACLFYAWMFFDDGLYLYSALSVATFGALAPFFMYNVWGDPNRQRKIFMGDTGSLTVGLMLSVLSIRMCQVHMPTEGANSAVVAFAPLLIPCMDVVRVYLHRIRAGRNPFLPDRSHIHHKLLALGMPQRVAMPVIISASALLTVANFLLSHWVNITLLLALDVLAWTAANMLLTRAIRRREAAVGAKLYD